MYFTGGYYKNVSSVCYSAGNAQPEGETKILLKDHKGKKALTVVSHMIRELMALNCCKETCKAHCTEQSWEKIKKESIWLETEKSSESQFVDLGLIIQRCRQKIVL